MATALLPKADDLVAALRSDAGVGPSLEQLRSASSALASAKRAKANPSEILELLHGFQALARAAPIAIAAGLDSGSLLNERAFAAFDALPAAQRTNACKAAIDLVLIIAERKLPAEMLPARALWGLAQLLAERAGDDALDIPSRSHAANKFIDLVEVTSLWSEKDEDEDEDEDEEDASTTSQVHITKLLLAALPNALATSRPLTTRLLHALSSAIFPWGGAIEDAVTERFDLLLDALDAPSLPIVQTLKDTTLGFQCNLAILRRLAIAASSTTNKEEPAAINRVEALTQLLRAQFCVDGANRDGAEQIAVRLVEFVAAHPLSNEESDALLKAVLAPPSDPPRIIDGIAALQPQRSALALLARAALLLPGLVLRLMPLSSTMRELEAALHGDASSSLCPLVELSSVAARQLGGSEEHFSFLASRASTLVLSGAGEEWLAALFAYPLDRARATLPTVLNALFSRVEAGASADLMHLLGGAATHLAKKTHEHLRDVHRSRRSRRAASRPNGAAADDSYDYMLEEAEAAEEEEALSSTLLLRLRADAVFACFPAVLACANSRGEGMAARVAAVKALGRFMHTHEVFAQESLPTLTALSGRDQPLPVRGAALLVLSSLLVAFPACTEQRARDALRSSLEADEPNELRRVALGALCDLLLSRRLQTLLELPHVLRVLADPDERLSRRAMSCLEQIASHEGGQRWCRLLHSALLQLCPTMPPPALARLLPKVIPSTLASVRPPDLEPLGEALVTHLVEAARREGCEGEGKGEGEGDLRRNFACVLSAWPPSDKSIAALRKALGGGGKPALFGSIARDAKLRQSVQTHVQRARPKCAGAALDEVVELLKSAESNAQMSGDESDEDGDEQRAPARGGARQRALPPEPTPTDEAERALEAVAALRAKRPLYTTTRLPELKEGAKHNRKRPNKAARA